MPAPTDFLTFNRCVRRLATTRLPTSSTSVARPSFAQSRRLQCRQFGTSYPAMEKLSDKLSDTSSSGTTSKGPHTTDKDNRLDVQSEYSGKAKEYVCILSFGLSTKSPTFPFHTGHTDKLFTAQRPTMKAVPRPHRATQGTARRGRRRTTLRRRMLLSACRTSVAERDTRTYH